MRSSTNDPAFACGGHPRALEAQMKMPLLSVTFAAMLASLAEAQQVSDARVSDLVKAGTLSRMLKHAQLVFAATPGPTFELLRSGQADAFASVRGVLLEYSAKLPGSRVLDEHYGANLVGMVVPKGQAARLAYISEFIEQAKASGLVR